MSLVAIVVLLALLEYIYFIGLVGRARGKHGIHAPAISGNEIFERYFRVQQNTLEQLIVFIPSIFIFGEFVSTLWAAIVGAVFVVGRAIYAAGYIRDPKKRELGFMLSAVPVLILLVGGIIGAVKSLIATGV
jgi:glutathione S-transferase